MATAYTPGLKVTERHVVRKRRILPLKGDVLVKVGDRVVPETVVAQTMLPGPVEPIKVANLLSVNPGEIPALMQKQIGERVESGEVIARATSMFGLFKSECRTKLAGTIESVSPVTGQVLVRGEPVPIQVKGYVTGTIIEVVPREGVVVETQGAFVQGIFGIGGETHGELVLVASRPDEELLAAAITPAHRGKIVIGGSRVTADALRKAQECGVAGIVGGGFDDKDLRDFLGRDLGVAITGNEELGVTLVVTEGFGNITMAERTFALLSKLVGRQASINGATQIRAGVIRPEIIVPIEGGEPISADVVLPTMDIGSPIRVIRDPYFGRIGNVAELPAALMQLESESHARVLVVKFGDGSLATIPRANVELIES